MTDDLRQPLKRRTLRDRLATLKPTALQVASFCTVTGFAAVVGWAMTTGDPMSGEPVVYVKIEAADPLVTASTRAVAETPPPDAAADKPEPDQPPPEATVDPEEEARLKQAALNAQNREALVNAPVKAVSERSALGVLPRIAKNGRKPRDVYARPVPAAHRSSSKPRIALIVGGMGLNSKLTRQAIADLPGTITFAFAPYGKRLQPIVNDARRDGHEILLQLPMEPFGYPAINPGPKTLLAVTNPAQNRNNLKWHLSRFAGYVGVTNYLGARFTAEAMALTPVLKELKKRGLLFVDDGASSRSMVTSMASVIGLPATVAQLQIGDAESYSAVMAALSRLEEEAQRSGSAIATATGLPEAIEAIASWSREVAERGIILVPVSALFAGRV